MPKIAPIQHTFSAGELSPRIGCRSDIEIYRKGLAYAKNMIVYSQGGITSRKGSEYFASVDGETGRVFCFVRNADEAYSVIISDDGNLYVTDEMDFGISDELVDNWDFQDGLDSWTVTSGGAGTVTVDNGIASMNLNGDTGGRNWIQLHQAIQTFSPDTLHTLIIDFPDNDGNDITVNVGYAPNTSELYSETTGGQSVTAQFTPVGDFYITFYRTAGNNVVNSKRINSVSCRHLTEESGIVTFSHPWTENLHLIHAKMPPGIDEMYFTHPNFPPQRLVIDASDIWNFAPISFVSPPATWTGTSWPRSITFHQGRAWWGGPDENFYGSQSGDYFNLDLGTAQADEAIAVTIDRRGEVMWLLGLETLLIGTRTGEHIATSEAGVITPGDIQVREQSSYGSNYCQPVRLGPKAAYVTADGRKVKDIWYQWTAEKWLSNDVTYFAEHLTEGTEIKELLWAQNPDRILAALLADGTAIVGLYDPDAENIGWTRVETNYGQLLSLCVANLAGQDRLGLLFNRGFQAPSLGPNTVSNGNFETGIPPAVPPDWNFISGDGVTELSDADFNSGGQSCRITNITGPGETTLQQIFDVEAGETYEWTVWMKHIGTGPSAGVSFYIRTVGGSNIDTTGLVDPSDWTQYTGSFVAPASQVRIDISAAQTNAEGFFDDISVRKVQVVSSKLFLEIDGADSYLESSHAEFNGIPSDQISEAQHLAGQTVVVKVDGALHPPVLIAEDGTGTLERTGFYVQYGLPYEQELRLMPLDFPQPGQTLMHTKRRWNKVWIRLYESVLPLVEDVVTPDRSPITPMDTAQSPVSGDVQVSTLGYEQGNISIRSNLPYRLFIIGVFGELATEQVF